MKDDLDNPEMTNIRSDTDQKIEAIFYSLRCLTKKPSEHSPREQALKLRDEFLDLEGDEALIKTKALEVISLCRDAIVAGDTMHMYHTIANTLIEIGRNAEACVCYMLSYYTEGDEVNKDAIQQCAQILSVTSQRELSWVLGQFGFSLQELREITKSFPTFTDVLYASAMKPLARRALIEDATTEQYIRCASIAETVCGEAPSLWRRVVKCAVGEASYRSR